MFLHCTEMKFSIKNFFRKCDEIRKFIKMIVGDFIKFVSFSLKYKAVQRLCRACLIFLIFSISKEIFLSRNFI